MFRGDLFVTIAEINTLILDICVCLHNIFFLFNRMDLIENDRAAKSHKVNLSQSLCS